MDKITNLLENTSHDNIRRFSFLWFFGNHYHENMSEFEGLSKNDLIDKLVEDFYWSELAEKVIIAQFEVSFQDGYFDNMLDKYVDFNAQWNEYNNSLVGN